MSLSGTIYLSVLMLLSPNIFATNINLGGIFDTNEDLVRAFEYVVNNINTQLLYNVTFTPLIKTINVGDGFAASSAACSLISSRTLGIFGPSNRRNIEGSQETCDFKAIPHVITRWTRLSPRGTTINMHPHPSILSQAYIDIIEAWGWRKFIILYENDESFLRITYLLKYAQEKGMYVIVRQLHQIHDDVYRSQMKEIRSSGVYHFVLDCGYEYLQEVLRQAQQVGLIMGKYSFFITNLDLHTIDVTDYSFSSVNMTGIRIVDPESHFVKAVSAEFLQQDAAEGGASEEAVPILRSDIALLMDGVEMYVAALNKVVKDSYELNSSLACDNNESWKDGYSVLNFMKTSNYHGLTGEIAFDHSGFRTNFQLGVIEVMERGVVQVGTWNSTAEDRLVITDPRIKVIVDDSESLRNKTFNVSICLTEPYAMWKQSPDQLEGNDQFEGYAIDLIDKLAELEGFKYNFLARSDTDNGGKNGTEWTGLVADIVYGRADLAIADLTITSERQEAVDFTEPFMNLGLTILYEKFKKEPPSFFSFASPFSYDTWLALLVSVFTVSFALYICARLSPDEWQNLFPCVEEPEYLMNEFHLKNSFWFTIGSLMQQGTELEPKGTTVRMVGGFWWFFVLIIVASYTANLAAFLTTENPNELFTSLDGLVENAERHGIAYGCKRGGATFKFFKGSQSPLSRKIYEYMSEHPENLASSNEEGVARAEKGKYAFFMETTSIDYTIQRHCAVDKVGKEFDANKGYGIALKKNSPYRKRLTLAILQLQSSGVLDKLKTKWWEERRGGGQCSAEDVVSSDAQPLYLMHVGGVFWVTIVGTVLAFFMALIEWFIGVLVLRRKKKITFKEAFMFELKFFFSFEGSKPDVADSLSSSKSKSKSKSRILGGSAETLQPGFIDFKDPL